MSKVIVEVHNFTDKEVWLGGRYSGGLVIAPQQPFGKGKFPLRMNIPDNSDSSKYFDSNQIRLDIVDPKTREQTTFTIWDDDWKNYDIFYCEGDDWKGTTKPMRGGNVGKDGTKIILHISERPADAMLPDTIKLPDEFQKYELTAFAVTDEQLLQNAASAFKTFIANPELKLDPKKKYTNQEILGFMNHKAFQPVKDAAAEGGLESIALIFGVEGTAVVGGEANNGVLWGLSDGSAHSVLTFAVCVGLDLGVDFFIGVYMSTGKPADVAGLEFFAQFAVGNTAGVGFVKGITLSGIRSVSIVGTLGVEVDVGVGVGWTKLSDV